MSDNRTSVRLPATLALLKAAGESGMNWREVAAAMTWHHGQATGPLSTLHQRGIICRLKERRDGCSIYVLPEHVAGRETAAYGRRGNGSSVSDLEKEISVLRRKVAKVEEVVAPKWRSYSYTRNDVIDDVRRALL